MTRKHYQTIQPNNMIKLINYNYGYYDVFSCSIHGKILVDQKTWNDIKRSLLKNKLFGAVLRDDLSRAITTKKGNLYNIRVTPTELVAKKYKLDNYKIGNYMFLVTSK